MRLACGADKVLAKPKIRGGTKYFEVVLKQRT